MSKFVSLENLARYDSKIKELTITQYSTMPEASSDILGKIVQYTGASVADSYINGYFYKCVSDGAETPTYSWEEVEVQAGGGASYTAGTNMSIDSNNAINCTIPYSEPTGNTGLCLGNTLNRRNAILIGRTISFGSSGGYDTVSIGGSYGAGSPGGCVVIGTYSSVAGSNQIAIGLRAKGSYNANNSIAIGNEADTGYALASTIAMGYKAKATKSNQAIFGSADGNINEMAMYTSNGVKVMATEDYADTKIAQLSTIPTASADNLGKIVQYVGTTDSTYTNGYFYKCVSDGEETPTYSWEEVEVQAGGGGASYTAGTNIDITNDVISSTIPYSDANNNIRLGTNISGTGSSAISIGSGVSSNASYTVAIGKDASNWGAYGTALGYRANVQYRHNGSIAIGAEAYTSAAAQCVIGGQYNNEFINEIIMSTSSGRKRMATEDYVDNLVGNINTVLATLTTPSNGGNA